MRFKTEQDGLLHAKKTKLTFDAWIELKKYMFAPEELISLRGYDHRGRRGKVGQSFRNHIINTYVDWVEGRPRCRVICIVRKNGLIRTEKRKAEKELNALNPHAMGDILSIELSPDGGKPGTHYACSWNCADSEYQHIAAKSHGKDNRHIFDGNIVSFDDAIRSLGLRRVGDAV